MKKLVSFNLQKITYSGQSVGRDIRIEIKFFEQYFKTEKRIQAGETKEINQNLGTFEFKDSTTHTVEIKVVEIDSLFNDTGSVKQLIKIDAAILNKVQVFTFSVKVRERRSWWKNLFWGGREAVFKIELEVEVKVVTPSIKEYSYRGVKGNEDYNHYDDLIMEIVDYWNNEFLRDTDPPTELLDPNLVKAMMYQESRVGYDKRNNGEINVIQVGNPGDPSLRTLRGELKEYWIHNDKQILLKYDARVLTVRDSIMWGVRWLYHKAQEIRKSDGSRNWLTWKEAVDRYGPPTEEYDRDVWSIYKNGVKKEGGTILQLWSFTLLIPFLFFSFFGHENLDLRSSILNSVDADQQAYVDDIEIKYNNLEPSIFAAVIEYEKDWSEELKLGVWNGEQIKWIDMEEEPTEQSILHFRFLKLKGFDKPLLEVYGQTHVGHGNIYIFEIDGTKANPIFKEVAVDINPDFRYNDEMVEKYNHYYCGEIYRGDALTATYEDINSDGIMDIKLSGIQDVYCEDGKDGPGIFYSESSEIKVAEIPIEKQFILK